MPPLISDMSRFLLTPNTTVFRVYGDAAMVSGTYFGKPMIEDPKTGKRGAGPV